MRAPRAILVPPARTNDLAGFAHARAGPARPPLAPAGDLLLRWNRRTRTLARVSGVRAGDIVAGKFEIQRVLGEGGMGYVVAARHLSLGQTVALKFLRQEVMTREHRTRFLREARNTVKLKSKHVSRVLDVGELPDGTPYMVMEYLEGTDLSDLLHSSGPLPVPVACEYVRQACEAVAEAHSHGIIHRDLKPANLFLTKGPGGEPIVKVLDFGVSKVMDLGVDARDEETSPGGRPRPKRAGESVVTKATDLLGSPSYMAPEQIASARDADRGSDIWSLGVILFRLTSGKAPFQAPALGELIQRIMYGPIPDLRAVKPDIPPGLEHVVARCLERDRTKRISDAAELARLLAPYAAVPRPTVPTSPPPAVATDVARSRNATTTPPGLSRTAATKTSTAGMVVLWAGLFVLVVAGSAVFFAKVSGGIVRPLATTTARPATSPEAPPPSTQAPPPPPPVPAPEPITIPEPPKTGTPVTSAKPKRPRPKPSAAPLPDDIPTTRE